MDNRRAAKTVFAIASLLEQQGGNPYRVRAYRRAALNLLRLPQDAAGFATEQGELALPWLGPRLRRKLGELVTSGQMAFYDQLLDDFPEAFRDLLSVPGIGPKTAERLVSELQIASLVDLAEAARGGRLRALRGMGEVRERHLGEAAESLLAATA